MAGEVSRQLFVKGLIPEKEYKVRLAPEGKELHQASGKELMEQGFRVDIPGLYGTNLYEIGLDQ